MTETPPPPPPGGPIPQPPAGGPAYGSHDFRTPFRRADPLDLALIGLAIVALVFSLLPFYKLDISVDSGRPEVGWVHETLTASAWVGFFGWFGVVLLLVAAVVVVLRMVGSTPPTVVVLVATLAVLGFLSELIALFVVPVGTVGDAEGPTVRVQEGHGWAYWPVLVLSLAAAAVAAYRTRRA